MPGPPFSMVRIWHDWGDPFLLLGNWPPIRLFHGSPTVLLHPVTHTRHSQLRRSVNVRSDEFFVRYRRARPQRRNRTPLVSNSVSTQSDLPRLRRFVCSVSEIRYCLLDFISLLLFTHEC
jgi:hypothetical protein